MKLDFNTYAKTTKFELGRKTNTPEFYTNLCEIVFDRQTSKLIPKEYHRVLSQEFFSLDSEDFSCCENLQGIPLITISLNINSKSLLNRMLGTTPKYSGGIDFLMPKKPEFDKVVAFHRRTARCTCDRGFHIVEPFKYQEKIVADLQEKYSANCQTFSPRFSPRFEESDEVIKWLGPQSQT